MNERRNGHGQKRISVLQELTQEQAMTINSHEGFGWSSFVRRPLFQQPQAVLVSPDRSVVALVDEEGDLVTEHDIKLRD
ncbi:MAG: hypothetical protein R3298_02925 [Gammaproteobacteria bacterium]|nr:hypothetical protein [Gammaproteobacteria bacterium]